MEENCEDERSMQRLRKATMDTVTRYSEDDNPFYHDERLLDVFCIIGRFSRTLGMKGVMEQLYERKQFYQLAEFYVRWGEVYAEEKDKERFNEVWNIAVSVGAKPLSRIDEAFR
ncbi:unnamed protein product [Gongylonema pulchrum]|uniref:BUB1 N-terminal domain-containing protein n=1 Tax=Gongylonema pulchrum TaxID=637853 RepID=A0A183EIR2_9BILA|nr:unnamed protein product [Gongylonema pulchrum]